MYQFTTRSGTTTIVNAGRITRLSANPSEDDPTLSTKDITGVPFMWVVPPVVGGRAVYRLKGETEVVTTTLILAMSALTPRGAVVGTVIDGETPHDLAVRVLADEALAYYSDKWRAEAEAEAVDHPSDFALVFPNLI